jgi:hypothetical protein
VSRRWHGLSRAGGGVRVLCRTSGGLGMLALCRPRARPELRLVGEGRGGHLHRRQDGLACTGARMAWLDVLPSGWSGLACCAGALPRGWRAPAARMCGRLCCGTRAVAARFTLPYFCWPAPSCHGCCTHLSCTACCRGRVWVRGAAAAAVCSCLLCVYVCCQSGQGCIPSSLAAAQV